MAELKRLLLSPKQIVTLLMLAVINLALFSGYCRNIREDQTSVSSVQTQALRSVAVHVVKGEKSADAEQEYLKTGYYEYLDYVQKQSAQQSILGKMSAKGSFVTRNLEKTAKDYGRLNDIRLRAGENRGIRAVMDFRITDFLLLIAPFLLIMELAADADSAVGALTRTTKRGRTWLCLQRIAAVVLLAAAGIILLYGGNILYAFRCFGDPVFSRPIQSVPDFQLCVLRVSVGGYYAICAFLKLLAVSAAALLVWILLSRFYTILGWLIAVPLLGIQYLCSTAIVPTAAFNHLKFLNLFTALHPDIFFTQYCNLNWFGHPSGFFPDTLIAVILCAVCFGALAVLLIGRMYPGRIGQRIETYKDRFLRKMNARLPVHSLFGFEGWKLLIAEHAMITAAVCAVFSFSLWRDTHVNTQSVDVQKFYTKYSGEITQEKIDKALKMKLGEEDKLEHDAHSFRLCMENGGSEDMKNMIRKHIFEDWMYLERYEEFAERMTSIREYASENGFQPYLIDGDVYMKLFQESAAERRCCMVLLLFMVFSFYGVRAYDNRYDTRLLLRSTKKGRGRMLAAQIAWCSILTAAAAAVLHGIYLLRLNQELGFPCLEAAAQNLELFRGIPFPVTLRTCIIALMLQRFAAAMLLNGLIILISRLCRTPQRALLVLLILFVLPTALAESGVPLMQRLDFVKYLSCCKSVMN